MSDFTITAYVRGPGRLIPIAELIADAKLRAEYQDVEDANGGIEILGGRTQLFVDDMLGTVATEFLAEGAAALRAGNDYAFRHRLSDEESTIKVVDGVATVFDVDRIETLTCPPDDLATAMEASFAEYEKLLSLSSG